MTKEIQFAVTSAASDWTQSSTNSEGNKPQNEAKRPRTDIDHSEDVSSNIYDQTMEPIIKLNDELKKNPITDLKTGEQAMLVTRMFHSIGVLVKTRGEIFQSQA